LLARGAPSRDSHNSSIRRSKITATRSTRLKLAERQQRALHLAGVAERVGGGRDEFRPDALSPRHDEAFARFDAFDVLAEIVLEIADAKRINDARSSGRTADAARCAA
jgi:hypothetical protein